MRQSENLDMLFAALSKAQVDISDPKKNALNPAFRNRYADVGQVWDVVKPVLGAHQLTLFLLPAESEQGQVAMEYLLGHWPSGQYISGRAVAPLTKQDLQGYGAALTYLTRYINTALFGLAAEDDDGNSAVATPAPRTIAKARDTRDTRDTTEPQGKDETAHASEQQVQAIQKLRAKLGLPAWKVPEPCPYKTAKEEMLYLRQMEKEGGRTEEA